MAGTLGGVALYCKYGTGGCKVDLEHQGQMQRMASGAIVMDNVGYRHVFQLSMHGMTAAQKNALKTKAVLTTSQTFVDPIEGNSYTVVSDPASWKERSVNDASGVFWFEADLTLYETSVN